MKQTLEEQSERILSEFDWTLEALRENYRRMAENEPWNLRRHHCSQCRDCTWFSNEPTWKRAKDAASAHAKANGHAADATMIDAATGEENWKLFFHPVDSEVA